MQFSLFFLAGELGDCDSLTPRSHPSLPSWVVSGAPALLTGVSSPLHAVPSQKPARGWLRFSACQLICWDGNIKHSEYCLLELGKLTHHSLLCCQKPPHLPQSRTPRGWGPPPSPPTRGDPASLLQPETLPSFSSQLTSSFSSSPQFSSSSCLFPSNPGSFLILLQTWRLSAAQGQGLSPLRAE